MAIVFDTEQGLPGRRDSGFPLQMAQGSVTALARACRDFGINIENPQPTIFYAGDTMDVRGAFMETARRAGFSPNTPPQLIVTYVSSIMQVLQALSDFFVPSGSDEELQAVRFDQANR